MKMFCKRQVVFLLHVKTLNCLCTNECITFYWLHNSFNAKLPRLRLTIRISTFKQRKIQSTR